MTICIWRGFRLVRFNNAEWAQLVRLMRNGNPLKRRRSREKQLPSAVQLAKYLQHLIAQEGIASKNSRYFNEYHSLTLLILSHRKKVTDKSNLISITHDVVNCYKRFINDRPIRILGAFDEQISHWRNRDVRFVGAVKQVYKYISKIFTLNSKWKNELFCN